MNNTEERITCTEEQITCTEERITCTEKQILDKEKQILEQKKREAAIKQLMSSFVDSDEEELMDALNNKKMPWLCGK